jgi:hypothetical protein
MAKSVKERWRRPADKLSFCTARWVWMLTAARYWAAKRSTGIINVKRRIENTRKYAPKRAYETISLNELTRNEYLNMEDNSNVRIHDNVHQPFTIVLKFELRVSYSVRLLVA